MPFAGVGGDGDRGGVVPEALGSSRCDDRAGVADHDGERGVPVGSQPVGQCLGGSVGEHVWISIGIVP